jgi:hypothetical protein
VERGPDDDDGDDEQHQRRGVQHVMQAARDTVDEVQPALADGSDAQDRQQQRRPVQPAEQARGGVDQTRAEQARPHGERQERL